MYKTSFIISLSPSHRAKRARKAREARKERRWVGRDIRVQPLSFDSFEIINFRVMPPRGFGESPLASVACPSQKDWCLLY